MASRSALVSSRVLGSRRRAAARQRALQRLAHEFAERYAELYAEERESA